MVGTDEEKNTTTFISLSAASQYALFLLERTGARALRKSGYHLARTSYGVVQSDMEQLSNN